MKDTTPDDEKVPTYHSQDLAIASDLLTDTLPRYTKVSLYGLKLERGDCTNVWIVYDSRGVVIDVVDVGLIASAQAILRHLKRLSEEVNDGE